MGRSHEAIWQGEAKRLDQVLAETGLARSRNDAAKIIAAGEASVAGMTAQKPSHRVQPGEMVSVQERVINYGRGAEKLRFALKNFDIDVSGSLALDVGASTGGFTQVLLEAEAKRVIALDVGHGQLVAELRNDERVVVVEGFNARELTARHIDEWIGDRVGLLVADVSFISLEHLLPQFYEVVAPGAHLVLLHKPQFEVGPGHVKNGVVKDSRLHESSLLNTISKVYELGFNVRDVIDSPILGGAGNREFLMHIVREKPKSQSEWNERINTLVKS